MTAGQLDTRRSDLDAPVPSRPIPQAFLVLYAISIALALGLGSVSWVTQKTYPLGGVKAGPWVAWPRIGSRDADPYARAIDARSATIPLALGEGLTVTADTDGTGQPLQARCTYQIVGDTPAARAWTLSLYDEAGRLPVNDAARGGFTSSEILRETDGTFVIVMGPEARPGNWLPTPAGGRLSLILRLYETPAAAASAALDAKSLPSITRLGCDP
jgi:hypothetical protein